MRLAIDIFEAGARKVPTITHVFYGSRRAIEGTVKAHMGTDSFLRGALERRAWRGIPLRVRFRWRR